MRTQRLSEQEVEQLVEKIQDAVAYSDGSLWREDAKKTVVEFLCNRDSATPADSRHYGRMLDEMHAEQKRRRKELMDAIRPIGSSVTGMTPFMRRRRI